MARKPKGRGHLLVGEGRQHSDLEILNENNLLNHQVFDAIERFVRCTLTYDARHSNIRPVIFEHSSYRSYLKSVLVERMKANPSYSLRALARQLGLSCSQLSETLNQKANFSSASLRKISKKLGLNTQESAYLYGLGELENEKDPEFRESVLKELQGLRPGKRPIHDLSLDHYKQISEWHHSVILEMVYLPDFVFTSENIAKRLSLKKLEVDLALERLLRLELLQQDEHGKFFRPKQDILFRSAEKNEAMRKLYRQMLEKISDALETQAPGERYSGYETLPFSPEAMPEMAALFNDFFERAIEVSRKYPTKKNVYHLALHFFNLTPTEPQKMTRP